MPQQVLIVDDDAATRADMIRILKGADPLLGVHEAPDGIEALKVLAETSIDVIITDLQKLT
jgi:CheY-like chemotaxis protein